jgi:DNA-binding transcriptional LysR family regulator
MPINGERPVPKKKRSSASQDGALDWEGARIFLEIARAKSFRAAAGRLNQSVNALRRKVGFLEKTLGVTLFTRHVDGMRLTEEGQRLVAAAQRMEAASFELIRDSKKLDDAMSGEIKLSVTEGLGSFWVAPMLVDFRTRYGEVTVNLRCAMSKADVLRLEADVAVQLEKPIHKDLLVVKLGRMHLMPFASRSYVKRHGMPKSAADLVRRPILVQEAEQLVPVEVYERQLGENVGPFDHIAIRSNLSGTHYFGIATGAGIGLLPTYCVALGAPIVPLELGYHTFHDIWLAYHQDAGRIPRVRALIDWLIELFSPRRFPWFSDEFVHPDDFPKTVAGLPPLDAYRPFTLGRNPR